MNKIISSSAQSAVQRKIHGKNVKIGLPTCLVFGGTTTNLKTSAVSRDKVASIVIPMLSNETQKSH